MHIFIYGPPGSGKTTLAESISEALDLHYYDLDHFIERELHKTIAQIFVKEGEARFREIELDHLGSLLDSPPCVIALGGGALLNPKARALVEGCPILCLDADFDTLLERVRAESGQRPLLEGDLEERLRKLLNDRKDHYQSFPLRLNTTGLSIKELTWRAQQLIGAYFVHGMGHAYHVRIDEGGLDRLGVHLKIHYLYGPVALVTDRNVGAIYLDRAVASLQKAGYEVHTYCIEPGENHKTIQTVMEVWDFLIRGGLDRGSTVVALGGGVVGDLTGFAASAFLRGVNWVNVPTTLLAMVDSSLGGKTGVDLPQAKNLIGAFYPPRLVLADPQLLGTLPERELRGGLAEAIKHGVIDDVDLFSLCEGGWQAVQDHLNEIVREGMAVKLKVIEQDPYEKDLRQALNLGHTIGHGVELASNFRLSHGESVAIGMVAEARLAERIGLARQGVARRIEAVLAGVGLPVEIPPDLPRERIIDAMRLDKKRAAGKVRFALPVDIGEVRTGVVIEDWEQVNRVLSNVEEG